MYKLGNNILTLNGKLILSSGIPPIVCITPTVVVTSITGITATGAIIVGNVTDEGGCYVVERGICWSTSANPTIADSKTTEGTGSGEFTSNLTGLDDDTLYHYRAYATNNEGSTAYSADYEFTTLIGTVTDIDGNVYDLVKIGTQVWSVQNLKTTKYKDNQDIPNVTDSGDWVALSSGAYCDYNNNYDNRSTYGCLYNWYAVETGKLAPEGYHIPTDNDWKVLEEYLGMSEAQQDATGWRGTDEGKDLKSATYWDGTNVYGFELLAAGYRYYGIGNFYSLGTLTFQWTSTQNDGDTTKAWYRRFQSEYDNIYRESVNKESGFSVRFIKD